MERKYVYLVIDDYTPDAGSTIYGVFDTMELAQDYVDNGIKADYGDDHDVDSIDIQQEILITRRR